MFLHPGTIEKCKYDVEIEFPDGAVAIVPNNIPALLLDLHSMQVYEYINCYSEVLISRFFIKYCAHFLPAVQLFEIAQQRKSASRWPTAPHLHRKFEHRQKMGENRSMLRTLHR